MTIPKNITNETTEMFYHFNNLIPNSTQVDYVKLKALLIPIINEREFELLVQTICAEKGEIEERRIKVINAAALSSRILDLAKQISSSLDINQKTNYLTVMVKLIQVNKQSMNDLLIEMLYSITAAFDMSVAILDTIWDLHFCSFKNILTKTNSVYLTNFAPDFMNLLQGYKVIYNPEFDFKIIVKRVVNSDVLLFKILEITNSDNVFMLKENDVIPYNYTIQLLLNRYKLTYEKIEQLLDQNTEDLKKIEILQTETTPKVTLDSITNTLSIEGYSINTQPRTFYDPIVSWVKEIAKTKPKSFKIVIQLRFLNTLTSKIFVELFSEIKKFEGFGCNLEVDWYYELCDEDMRENGEIFSSIVDKEFHYVPYEFAA